jgi:hypothetical protein
MSAQVAVAAPTTTSSSSSSSSSERTEDRDELFELEKKRTDLQRQLINIRATVRR